jgi:putative addiction module killer protein
VVKVTEYQRADGKSPFRTWFDSLGARAALKVNTSVEQMRAGNFGDHKSVGGGVFERRVHFEKGYRVYYARDGEELVLLFCGGTKTRQQSDIDKAKKYWSDYKRRKKQGNVREGETNGTYTRFQRDRERTRRARPRIP